MGATRLMPFTPARNPSYGWIPKDFANNNLAQENLYTHGKKVAGQ